MYEAFVCNRITQLRLQKGVSEDRMRDELGLSQDVIRNISSGKALPSIEVLFAICDYFGITPQQFFDDGTQNPELMQKAISGMKELSEDDLRLLLTLIHCLNRQ